MIVFFSWCAVSFLLGAGAQEWVLRKLLASRGYHLDYMLTKGRGKGKDDETT